MLTATVTFIFVPGHKGSPHFLFETKWTNITYTRASHSEHIILETAFNH